MPDLIVIGAGLSGLALARAAAQRGDEVVMLEARARVGGRVLSHRSAAGAYDLGPAWVWPGIQPRIAQAVQAAGLSLHEQAELLLTDVMRADAFVFAEKLRMSIEERPVEWAGAKATITMSIGFAATPSWQGEVSQLLARADAALYEAKRGGRNRVVLAREYLVEVA